MFTIFYFFYISDKIKISTGMILILLLGLSLVRNNCKNDKRYIEPNNN